MPDATCREPDCDRPAGARGLCKRCWKRHWRNGTLASHPLKPKWGLQYPAEPLTPVFGSDLLPEVFWSRLRVTESGCWEWTSNTSGGYGLFCVGGRVRYVHRLVYMVFTGEIPAKYDLDHYRWPDHGCIGRLCALHTRPVTRRENLYRSDGILAANLAKTHCLRGHPFSGDNLYLDRNENRHCRECRRNWKRARRRAQADR